MIVGNGVDCASRICVIAHGPRGSRGSLYILREGGEAQNRGAPGVRRRDPSSGSFLHYTGQVRDVVPVSFRCSSIALVSSSHEWTRGTPVMDRLYVRSIRTVC